MEALWLVLVKQVPISLGAARLVMILKIVQPVIWAIIASRLGNRFDEVEISSRRLLAIEKRVRRGSARAEKPRA